MSIAPEITDAQTVSPTAPSCDGADAWAQRRLEILAELAEAGLEIAMALKGRIIDTTNLPPDPAAIGEYNDLARAFDRVSRATRLAIALRDRLAKDEPLHAPGGRTEAREARDERACRVMRIVERATRAGGHHRLMREAMENQARERLFDPDITGDLLNRPIGELVAQICADLGLKPPWLEFAEEAWAQAEIAERPPGSPYAAWPDLPPDPFPDDLEEDADEDDDNADGEDERDDPGGSGP